MQPLIVHPHPLAMQPVAYIMRGPIVYCVEGVDHPWEQDHFKVIADMQEKRKRHAKLAIQKTIFDLKASLKEEPRSEPDSYVAIVAEKGAVGQLDTSAWNRQIVAESKHELTDEARDLYFIPYYLRANRGGNWQMRVGLRVV